MNFIIGLFAKPIGSLLAWIYGLVNNYGLSIIILTLLVRLILLPLYTKQIRYQSKMTEVQPKLKEIQEKYANDRDTLSMKTMELYREEGISPSSGCLPLLIQMPIIMGLLPSSRIVFVRSSICARHASVSPMRSPISPLSMTEISSRSLF